MILAAMTLAVRAQDHAHLNAGASGPQLTFDNGSDFAGDYVKTLTFTDSGKFAQWFEGNITLTALHSTNAFGEIDPAAPRPGAFIVAEIVSVSGPAGGEFAFWDSTSTTAPTVSLPVGTTNSSFRFDLSQSSLGGGEPGGDPFGHIHGRRFTASKPGLYTVGFRAYDTSTNGLNGQPLHTPSALQSINFQAGVNLTALQLEPSHVMITLGAMSGYSWQLQANDSMSAPDWKNVGDALLGNDALQEVEDHQAQAPYRFYRAIGTAVEP
ncbi:MAG TPA: hypothetical protein VK633_11175 [Verrucomicrobiae bacterium]|nr:hypothetical protein [Verrucomicrobiae bacterium]